MYRSNRFQVNIGLAAAAKIETHKVGISCTHLEGGDHCGDVRLNLTFDGTFALLTCKD
jgi:hypothetical protein